MIAQASPRRRRRSLSFNASGRLRRANDAYQTLQRMRHIADARLEYCVAHLAEVRRTIATLIDLDFTLENEIEDLKGELRNLMQRIHAARADLDAAHDECRKGT